MGADLAPARPLGAGPGPCCPSHMLHGLYAAASALDAHARREEAIADNLANLQTIGFKRRVVTCSAFDEALGLVRAEGGADRTQGDLASTDGPLDLGLLGPGYLVVDTPAGERLTRDGQLRVDAQGTLTTASGLPVLGRTGRIRVEGPPGDVRFAEDGRVTVGGQEVGRLRVVEVADEAAVSPEGQGLLRARGPTRDAATTTVRQGCLERSNADPTTELIGLITLHRSFEAAGRAVETTLRALERTANELR